MSEKAYIKLLIEDKYLFCGRIRCQSKIFWPCVIRYCGPCLKVHAIDIITQLIPFATANKHQDHQYYFYDQIIELEQEIKNVPLEDFEIWCERNKVEVDIDSITKEIKKHIQEDQDYI
ncbi:12401_t:CDS:2 [Gigaspora margarita]|uniref:12401_t:CDS:1 n=1 Tax=Gigaspora margarita TaxID=4874 RepID=A0ABN7UVL2_GIGMA|nr:12401_t:CDS:2 [Gigaspora margarita]